MVVGLLDAVPNWGVFLITVGLILLSVEIGHRLAKYQRDRPEGEKVAAVGPMVAASLGLLAFMLAFTFGMAGSMNQDRRVAVLAEANAIGTTYLRAGLLPKAIATESRNLLREYVDVRLEAVRDGDISQGIAKSQELQNRLWSQAVAASETDRSPVTALFVQSLNEVIDLDAKRVMVSVRSRVPQAIWMVLYLLAALSMGEMGYHQGLVSARRSLAVLALVFAFSAVLYLIVDLDRPTQGLLRVSQQSMIDLRNSMSSS